MRHTYVCLIINHAKLCFSNTVQYFMGRIALCCVDWNQDRNYMYMKTQLTVVQAMYVCTHVAQMEM